jgi:hypothetical protein
MSNLDVLKKVRALLRGHWTQYANARDAHGKQVPPIDPRAVNFCLRGAAIHVLQPTASILATDLHVETSPICKKINRALHVTSNQSLIDYNDEEGRTEQHVIEYLTYLIDTYTQQEKDNGQGRNTEA